MLLPARQWSFLDCQWPIFMASDAELSATAVRANFTDVSAGAAWLESKTQKSGSIKSADQGPLLLRPVRSVGCSPMSRPRVSSASSFGRALVFRRLGHHVARRVELWEPPEVSFHGCRTRHGLTVYPRDAWCCYDKHPFHLEVIKEFTVTHTMMSYESSVVRQVHL